MKKTVFMISLVAGLMLTSCGVKKELYQACQDENKALQTNYQDTKEQLAAANTRVSSLQEQLNALQQTNATLQKSLDKSLTNASQNNIYGAD